MARASELLIKRDAPKGVDHPSPVAFMLRRFDDFLEALDKPRDIVLERMAQGITRLVRDTVRLLQAIFLFSLALWT